MSFFNPTPEERAEKTRRKAEEQQQALESIFNSSPAGRARAEKLAGSKIFQIDVPLSRTTGRTVAMIGAYADSTKTKDYSSLIESIEAEGWRLDHVGYIYRITGSVSRDKFLASGQEEATSGEIVGIYIFRAT